VSFDGKFFQPCHVVRSPNDGRAGSRGFCCWKLGCRLSLLNVLDALFLAAGFAMTKPLRFPAGITDVRFRRRINVGCWAHLRHAD
jgi:hypothetical protein